MHSLLTEGDYSAYGGSYAPGITHVASSLTTVFSAGESYPQILQTATQT